MSRRTSFGRRGIAIWELIAVVAVLLVLVAILWPVKTCHPISPHNETTFHIKSTALGHLMYAEDNDDQFCMGANWETTIEPYIKNDEQLVDTTAPDKRGKFAMHEATPGQKTSVFVPGYAHTLLFTTLIKGESVVSNLSTIRPYDHRGRKMYFAAFVDGSAKRVPIDSR